MNLHYVGRAQTGTDIAAKRHPDRLALVGIIPTWLIVLLVLLSAGIALASLSPTQAQSAARVDNPTGGLLASGAKPAVPACDPNWVIVSSPDQGTDHDNFFHGVAQISANDVWAVGSYAYSSTLSLTLIEHWDGTSWSIVSSPNLGTDDNILNGVVAVSSNDVWAVGYWCCAAGSIPQRTLVEHWNGSAWSVVTSPNQAADANELFGVAAVSATDVWAVGYYYTNGYINRYTLVERWNGTAWAMVSSPNPGQLTNILNGVVAVSSNDVWAVGYWCCAAGSTPQRTLVEHWNGSHWSVVTSPYVPGADSALNGVSAVSSTDVWAVGTSSDFTLQTLVEHWNGSAWSIVPSPNVGTDHNELFGVAAVSASEVWAVGDYMNGSIFHYSLVEHWDGRAWSVVPSPNLETDDNILKGVATLSATDVWAVGHYVNGSYLKAQTLVDRYNPCPATPTPFATRTPIPGTCNIIFSDVPTTDGFYPFIECLACHNIVSGYQCGGPYEPCNVYNDPYFRPGNNVTRGQAAKFISSSAAYSDTIPSTQQTFNDVPPNSTFWLYVERVYQHGVISGYQCGGQGEPCPGQYFRPGNNLTRGQLAKIDANAAEYNDSIPSTQRSFNDVPSSDPFWVYIERVHLHNIISGYQCGGVGEPCPGYYFRPHNNVTRAQTSKIVSGTFFPNCQAPYLRR